MSQQHLVALASALLLSACTVQISSNPVADLLGGGQTAPAARVLVTDLQTAAANLDAAAAAGILDRSDQAPQCLHSLLKQEGIDTAAAMPAAAGSAGAAAASPASINAKIDGAVSAASVLYIRFQQLKKIENQGISLDPGCKQVIGQMVIDAAERGKGLLPGGRLLPPVH
jgi:hypothetical protein